MNLGLCVGNDAPYQAMSGGQLGKMTVTMITTGHFKLGFLLEAHE